jgi:hypothetical protein
MTQEYRNRIEYFRRYYQNHKNIIKFRASEHHVANRETRTQIMRDKYISYQDIMKILTQHTPRAEFKPPIQRVVDFVVDLSDS